MTSTKRRRRKGTSKINKSECFKHFVNAQAFKNAFEGKKEVEGEGGAMHGGKRETKWNKRVPEGKSNRVERFFLNPYFSFLPTTTTEAERCLGQQTKRLKS